MYLLQIDITSTGCCLDEISLYISHLRNILNRMEWEENTRSRENHILNLLFSGWKSYRCLSISISLCPMKPIPCNAHKLSTTYCALWVPISMHVNEVRFLFLINQSVGWSYASLKGHWPLEESKGYEYINMQITDAAADICEYEDISLILQQLSCHWISDLEYFRWCLNVCICTRVEISSRFSHVFLNLKTYERVQTIDESTAGC